MSEEKEKRYCQNCGCELTSENTSADNPDLCEDCSLDEFTEEIGFG